MKSNIFSRLTMLLFLYFFFSLGFIFSRGFYTLAGSLIILIATFLLLFLLFKPEILALRISRQQFINLLRLGLCLNLVLTWWLYGGLYQQSGWALQSSRVLLEILLAVSLFLLFKNSAKYLKWLTIFLAVVWLGLHSLMIFSSPRPWIDVYEMLKNAPLALVKGQNPYSINYKKMYTHLKPDHFAYLPFMFLYTAPFVFLLNDPRWAFVAAQFLTFFLVVKKFPWKNKLLGRQFSYLLGLLILFQPLALFMTEQSYTEALILLEITALYYFITQKKQKLSALILGISLATKQYLVFALPFLFKNKLLKKRTFMLSFGWFFIFTLPFLIWNSQDFIHDVVLLQQLFPPRYEGLSFFSFLFHHFGFNYSMGLALLIWLGLGILIYQKADRRHFNFIFSYTLFLLIFFFFNKWAFINYYYLIANLFLLSFYALLYQSEHSRSTKTV